MWRLNSYLTILLLFVFILTVFSEKDKDQGRTLVVPLLIVPPTAPTRHQVRIELGQKLMFTNTFPSHSSFGALVYPPKSGMNQLFGVLC